MDDISTFSAAVVSAPRPLTTNPRHVKAYTDFYRTLKDNGFVAITPYVRTDRYMTVKCAEGHSQDVTPSEFKRRPRCTVCTGRFVKAGVGTAKLHTYLRTHGLTLTSPYINMRTPLSTICRVGHAYTYTKSHIYQYAGCVPCNLAADKPVMSRKSKSVKSGAAEKLAGKTPTKAVEEAKAAFFNAIQIRGYSVMGAYIGAAKPVSLRCPEGHIASKTPAAFRAGSGCRVCSKQDKASNAQRWLDYVKAAGFTSCEAYISSKTPVTMYCPAGHECRVAPNNFYSGTRCRRCRPNGFDRSKAAVLYYIAFYPQPGRAVYKIGITNHNVKRRYARCKTPYEILWTQEMTGWEAYEKELYYKRTYRAWLCADTPVDSIKNSELFDVDIFAIKCAATA